MVTDNLTLSRNPTQDLVDRLDQQVISEAKPSTEDLLQARADLTSDPDLQALFAQAFQEDHDDVWLVDALAKGLDRKWREDGWVEFESETRQAAQYLVDEYRQLGEGTHLISPDTGRVLYTLQEGDVWQPSMVPREGGGFAKPLPQLRPDLASFLTTWTFNKAREEEVVAKLAAKGHQTALLVEEGDPRLLVATRRGRAHIATSLSKFDPETLLKACGGTSGMFLKHFELTTEGDTATPSDTLTKIEGEANSFSKMGIQDQTTVNLHHNRAATLQGALTQGWVRHMAKTLTLNAVEHYQQSGSIEALRQDKIDKTLLSQSQMWVAPPEAMIWLRRADPSKRVLPVAGIQHILGLKAAKVGAIQVPLEFSIHNRELFDRWETGANLKYTLWVDWSTIVVKSIEGLEYQAVLDV